MRSSALNASKMKNRNYRLILEELRISPFSRSELARRTGLTRAAVSLIVDSLIRGNILIEGKTILSKTAGRSPTELHWNPSVFYCIGVVIRRNYFGTAFYDFCGNKIFPVERHLIGSSYVSADEIIEVVFEDIDLMMSKKPAGKLLGIGIGAPGPIDAELGLIENPTNLDLFNGVPIVDMFKKRYNCPVHLANDACTHALAELSYGIKDRYNSFAVLEVTGGIGAGLVLDGKLTSGAFGNGNEIGHTTINVFGEKCGCGNVGCAELYATLSAISEKASKKDPRLVDWRSIVDYALSGLPAAIKIMNEEAFYLSTLVVNLLNMHNIDAIIINGIEICYRPEYLISLIKDKIEGRLLHKKYRKTDLLASTIIEDADALSAANLAIESYLKTSNAASDSGVSSL